MGRLGQRGQDWGMGCEGERRVENDSMVLTLARTSVMVILLIKTGNTREKQDVIHFGHLKLVIPIGQTLMWRHKHKGGGGEGNLRTKATCS